MNEPSYSRDKELVSHQEYAKRARVDMRNSQNRSIPKANAQELRETAQYNATMAVYTLLLGYGECP